MTKEYTDIDNYSLEDMLTSAIKAEAEANEVYTSLAGKVKNAFLKDRLLFLAGEEAKHKMILEDVWHKKFPGVGGILPDKSPVPMPKILIWDENMPISEVLTSAMEAEHAASEFYKVMASKVEETDTKQMLLYLSKMEAVHFRILEEERKNVEIFEDYDTPWPMMHVGP